MSGPGEWRTGNQAGMVRALDRIRRLLRGHADRALGADPVAVEADDPGPTPPALAELRAAFGLSDFESDLLLACAGVELDSGFGSTCAAAQGDPTRPFPTFSLAMAALPGAHWSALAPDGPLRRWRLVELGAGPALTTAPLRVDERVLHHLVGLATIDERVAAAVERIEPAEASSLPASHATSARSIAAAWSAAGPGRSAPVVRLSGPDPADRRALTSAAASLVGMRAMAISADHVPAGSAELDAFLRLWDRESALVGLVLVIECDEPAPRPDHQAGGPDHARGAARLADRSAGRVVLSDREPIGAHGQRPTIAFEVARPTLDERLGAWRSALGPAAEADRSGVEAVASQFAVGLPTIRSAAALALARRAESPGSGLGRLAWDACRSQARGRLDDLAHRIEPGSGWDDLVLPELQARTVRRIAQHVRHRGTVDEAWGFAAHRARGLGITALFAGASGTGKTLAAEVIAGAIGLDLYRVDLACLVSKYIGETEKNLRRVFDAAEGAGAILLFDEADALFGKRSEVKDSHDRHANIEVSYLLQRMETYRGLAILTTNLKGSLDTAFLRRLRFIVQFPFPDPAQRAEIWRRAFPPATPTRGLDPIALARLNVSGGTIRNIALMAAFLAAEDGRAVEMAHLRAAAELEYAKLERPLTEAEVDHWG